MIKFREYRKQTDESFIYANWLCHFFEQSYFAIRITDKIYFEGHRGVIDKLLQKSQTLMAVDEQDEDVIVGFMVYELSTEPVIHYIFIKEDFRKIGIGKKLLAKVTDGTFSFTHWSYDVDKIEKKSTYQKRMIYNPYLLGIYEN